MLAHTQRLPMTDQAALCYQPLTSSNSREIDQALAIGGADVSVLPDSTASFSKNAAHLGGDVPGSLPLEALLVN